MARVLNESASIGEYWLEPGSREVKPVKISTTDLNRKVLHSREYSPGAGLELRAGAGKRTAILIDFGKEVGGYPRLEFGTGDMLLVGAVAAENVERVPPALLSAITIADHSITRWSFRPSGQGTRGPHCGGFRYLWVFPESPGRATLRSVKLDYTPYSCEDRDSCGYFLCSDNDLNRAWFAGLHTLEMCTVDPALGGHDARWKIGEGPWVITDGASKERLVCGADLAAAAPASLVSDWNVDAVRDSILSLAKYQEPNGYVPACSPGPPIGRLTSSFFGDYTAWWVVALHSYYIHTGDTETVEALFPAMKRALHYLFSQCRGGLFRQTPLNMAEWCFSVLRRGRPSYTSIIYYWALQCGAYISSDIGEDEVASGFMLRATRLKETVEKVLWDHQRCVFIDSTADRGRVPQDANSLAIVSGLASEPIVADTVLDYMKSNMWVDWGSTNVDVPYYRLTPGMQPHNKRVVPFMNSYEAQARFIAGDAEGAMELMRRCWGNMLDHDPGTFWEWVGKDGTPDSRFSSLCSSWSTGMTWLLTKYVLGIRPARAGYRTFRFDPELAGLEWAEGRIPVPGGFIEARVETSAKGITKRVSAPEGLEQEKPVGRAAASVPSHR
jgi:hypothetical protein